MGAAAGAIAAIHARRIREILDAYRTAPATTAGSARAPAELGLDDHHREFGELVAAGVLREGAQPGSFFLDERSYVAYRDGGLRKRKIALFAVLLLVAAMAMAGIFTAASAR